MIYEWVQTGLVTDIAFDSFVYGYGNRSILVEYHNSWFSVTIMCAVVSYIVQSFFAWRIWILGRPRLLMPIILFVRPVRPSHTRRTH